MIICTADKAGRLLTISYSRHVGTGDMRRCLETVHGLMHQLKPGFLLLSDLSHLDSMDAECAHELGMLMDLTHAGGVSAVLRVMPDPSKDIGFNIVSRFHHPPPVRTETHSNLADAIQSLVIEHQNAAVLSETMA
jgi:hypothetical protein